MRCAAALEESIRRRDSFIVSMRNEGYSLRQIAHAAQLTPEGVRGVLRRRPQKAGSANAAGQLHRWAAKARTATEERARLLVALRTQVSERRLAELSGLSRTAVRHQLMRMNDSQSPRIVRARS